MINDETRKHKIKTERDNMVKFRKNQEVQKYLKDQMAFVERQKEINLHKKSLDALDVKKKAKEYQNVIKQKS